ncbi:MAG: CapA family protein [Treponema sp.]|jgi:poly-gamma-glutamate synthesis protein (capsule biosynthesis protein)|nr:CapA family protein [Treponema sp.]
MKRFSLAVLSVVFLLCSCTGGMDRAAFGEGEGPERAFLEAALNRAVLETLGLRLTGAGEDPGITIEFHSSWEFEKAWGDILISRTWSVPQGDPLTPVREATLAGCLEGQEILIPLRQLAPPYTALPVDGLCAGDEGYALIRAAGVSLKIRGKGKRIREKAEKLEAYIREMEKPLIEEKPSVTWIVAAGDLMLERGAQDILLARGPEGLFGAEAAKLFREADIALVNLEGPLSLRGEKAEKTYTFRFDPSCAGALKAAGISGALFANNHAFDYGTEAFLDTLSCLEEAGIAALGAGENEAAASRPLVFQNKGFSARIFGIASFFREASGWDGFQGTAEPEKPGMLHAAKGGVRALKAGFFRDWEEGLDIVLFHGGEEWSTRPGKAVRELYADLIGKGADLLIGSHPHIVQGFEWIKGKPVFWSLGNFVFSGMENSGGGDRGLLIRLGYWGSRLLYLEPYALALSGPATQVAGEEHLIEFYERSLELDAARDL